MSDSFSSGMRIGRFHLEGEVGRGSMGVVYRALDPVLNRPVALKLLVPHLGGDRDNLARFHREAALVASLKHPHIATIYEFGEHEGRPYIAMEWIEGCTLKELLATERLLPLERSLRLFDQLAAALDHAHRRGVVHRDLKPANIIVGPDDQVTIVDFGLAWLETAPSITTSGVALGTPLYMSPEQIRGEPAGGRSDLYSLAVILYEMLAGQPPFQDPSTQALFYQQLYALPPPITECNPGLPARIENALTTALAKDPADRFPTAAMLGTALRAPATPVQSEHASSNWRRSFIKVRPSLWVGWPQGASWRRWLLTAIVLLSLGLIAVVSLPSLWRSETPAAVPTPTSAPTIDISAQAAPPNEDGLWPMIGGPVANAGFVDEEWNPLNPEPRWSQPQSEGGTSPVVGGGRVVFGVDDRAMRALDWATGEPLWETLFGANVIAPPTIYPDPHNMLVFAATEDGALYGLALDDRRLIWHIGAGDLVGALSGGVNVGFDGAVYAATDSGILHIIDPLVGEVNFSLDLSENDSFSQPPIATNVAIFLSGEQHTVCAIDRTAGDIAWTAETLGRPTTPPVVGEAWGVVLVGTDEGRVHAFSMITGKAAWQGESDSAIVGLAYDGARVYAASASGLIHAWDGWNGEEAWRLSMDSAVGVGPVTNGKYVMVGTEAGDVRYIETESGEENPQLMLALGEPIVYSLAPAGGWLFVRTDRAIYGFGP